jgi:hypothetical protein
MCTCALRISSVFIIIMFVLTFILLYSVSCFKPCWLSCRYVLGWFGFDVTLRWWEGGEGRLCIHKIFVITSATGC